MKPERNSCLSGLRDPEDDGTLVLREVSNYSTNNTATHSICSNTTVTTTNVRAQSNKSYRILANLVNYNMRCATELKGVTFNIKLRFIQIIGRYRRCTSVCQANVTEPKLYDRDLHLPDGVEDCSISTRRTSLITWKVFMHQAVNPICSTRQAVHHSHVNLLGKIGSRIWVKES